MRVYIATTGTAFGAVVLAHVARMIQEGTHLLTEPIFLAATAVSAGLCAWAVALLVRRPSRS